MFAVAGRTLALEEPPDKEAVASEAVASGHAVVHTHLPLVCIATAERSVVRVVIGKKLSSRRTCSGTQPVVASEVVGRAVAVAFAMAQERFETSEQASERIAAGAEAAVAVVDVGTIVAAGQVAGIGVKAAPVWCKDIVAPGSASVSGPMAVVRRKSLLFVEDLVRLDRLLTWSAYRREISM